jgi:hypothetical protein
VPSHAVSVQEQLPTCVAWMRQSAAAMTCSCASSSTCRGPPVLHHLPPRLMRRQECNPCLAAAQGRHLVALLQVRSVLSSKHMNQQYTCKCQQCRQ